MIAKFLFVFQLFLNCLCNLQNNLVLTEIDTERLFCNIPEIYAANRVFWHDYIMPMLTQSRKTGEPLNPSQMKEGFLKVLILYTQCLKITPTVSLYNIANKGNYLSFRAKINIKNYMCAILSVKIQMRHFWWFSTTVIINVRAINNPNRAFVCMHMSMISLLSCCWVVLMIHQQLFICIPQFEEIFHPYSRYCSEQTNCQDYCKEQDRNSEVFKAYLAVSLPFEFILLREQSERNELRLYIPNISILKRRKLNNSQICSRKRQRK